MEALSTALEWDCNVLTATHFGEIQCKDSISSHGSPVSHTGKN